MSKNKISEFKDVLKQINPYVTEVSRLRSIISMDPRYGYLTDVSALDLVEGVKDDMWNNLSFAIIDNDVVVGAIKGGITQPIRKVNNILFFTTKVNPSIALDAVKQFFYQAFIVNGLTKIKFSVDIGNPAEKFYDNLLKRYNIGRVVGIFEKDVMNQKGTILDSKWYEILREEYMVKYNDEQQK